MLFMLQKEMALRLSARPGVKSYGSLSVRAQVVYDVNLLRSVPPEVFFPRPDVDSALVSFKRKAAFPSLEIRKALSSLVKTAFAKRRKKMFKPLTRHYPPETVERVYELMSVSKDIRSEAITPEAFVEMAIFFMEP